MSELTPEQAADVIKYYHDGENAEAREKGWLDKVPLGRSAIHTSLKSETLLPGGQKPMLTPKEMSEGLELLQPSDRKADTKSNEYYAMLDELVDKLGISYDDARRRMEE